MPSIFAYPRQLFRPFRAGEVLATAPSVGPMRQRLGKGRMKPDLEALTQRIILPSLPVPDEDLARLGHWETGRRLARQDKWNELSDLITSADDARLTTPGGADEATLLAMGAQSDVVAAAADALKDGAAPDPAGLADLQYILDEMPGNPAISLVVSLAHLNIGRAWVSALPHTPQLVSEHQAHFSRAQALLDPFDAEELDAPSVASAQCVLAEILCTNTPCIANAHHTLIRLDPDNANHLRALGRSLVHGLADDPTLLEVEIAALDEETTKLWGDAAYTWVYLDALAQSDEAVEVVDTDRFSNGLRRILQHRPDQHVTNEIAVFCAIAMAPQDHDQNRTLAQKRAELHDNLNWVLSDHLAELHPILWSSDTRPPTAAPRNTVPRALVAQGRRTALRVIAHCFADQLADGSSIAFSPAGMYRLPAI